MEFRQLTQEEYDRKLREVIVGAEGLHARVQDVGDGRATIGWGYTLNRDNNVAIWTQSGIGLTQEQIAALARVDRAPLADKTVVGLTFDRVLTESESDQLFRASISDYEAPAVSAGMPLSDERIALVSVTYNRGVGALRDHPLVAAIEDGERAEAWYQLRYNCWGSRSDMEGGLRKRRFAEAEVFGLYSDRGAVSVEEAVAVYEMYRNHYAEIDRVERAFGVKVNGVEAQPDRIAQANRDYASIVANHGAVRTIADSLEPARTRMIEHLRQHYPGHAQEFTEASFNAAQIDLDRFPPVMRAEAREEAFGNRYLDDMLDAVAVGDDARTTRIMQELARSAQGQAFLRQGEQLLYRQQAVGHEPR